MLALVSSMHALGSSIYALVSSLYELGSSFSLNQGRWNELTEMQEEML